MIVERSQGRISGYVCAGKQRCPAAHRSDLARLCRLAVRERLQTVDSFSPAPGGVRFARYLDVIGTAGVETVSMTPEHSTEPSDG